MEASRSLEDLQISIKFTHKTPNQNEEEQEQQEEEGLEGDLGESDYFDYTVNLVRGNKGISFDCSLQDGQVIYKFYLT